jgi:hypothetical protein
MPSWRGALAVVLVCGACGGSATHPEPEAGASAAPPSGTYHQGSRLRAHFWDGGGGATAFIDWYDSLLSISCAFGVGEDGKRRCLPTAQAPSGPSLYLDAACTKPARTGATTAFEVSLATAATCIGADVTLHVDVLTSVIATSLYSSDGTSCVPAIVPAGTTVAAVQPADPSQFLEVDTVVEDRGGGLDLEVLVAKDGTRQLGRTLDHARSVACIDQHGRCIATTASGSSPAFTDPSCTQTVVGAFGCYIDRGCPPPPFAVDATTDPASCATTLTGVHALAATPVFAYEGSSGSACMPAGVNQNVCGFFPEAAAVDVATFPAMSDGRIGTGRLVEPTVNGPDGRLVADVGSGFLDTQSGQSCQPASFADGVSRCVGQLANVSLAGERFFADAACTQPLALVESAGGCSGTPAAYAAQYDDTYTMDASGTGVFTPGTHIQHVFPLGARFQGATVYAQIDASSCFALGTTTGPYALVEPEVAADTVFARVVETTAPPPTP